MFARVRISTLSVIACYVIVCGPVQADNCEWSLTSAPMPGATVCVAYDVAAIATDEAYAVGYRTGSGPFFVSWDGTDWTSHDVPDVSGLPGIFPTTGPNLRLTGIAALQNGDVWAVGRADAYLPSFFVGWPIVARWDGSGWRDIQQIDLGINEVYPNYDIGGVIEGASYSPDGDIWAYGTKNSGAEAPGIANIMTFRYHSGIWENVPFPVGFGRINIVGEVLALDSDNAWLVGYGNSAGVPFSPVIAHWNGSAWSSEPTPVTASAQTFTTAVCGTGPDDIWIGGETPGGALLMHFDGSDWTIFPSPAPATTRINELVSLATDDVWAWSIHAGAFHFDGIAWSAVTIPLAAGSTSQNLSSFVAVPGATMLWGVGTNGAADGNHAMLRAVHCNIASADINGDGDIDISDRDIFVNVIMGIDDTAAYVSRCDMNADGLVDGRDVQVFVSALVGT